MEKYRVDRLQCVEVSHLADGPNSIEPRMQNVSSLLGQISGPVGHHGCPFLKQVTAGVGCFCLVLQ